MSSSSSRNVLAGATRHAALLQPVGGRDTASARQDFKTPQKKWSLGISSGPADPKAFLDLFNTSRGMSLGFPSSLNPPLLLSLSVLSHCEIPKLPPLHVPCMCLLGQEKRSVTHHRACCQVMQQGLSPSLAYQKKGQCHQMVTHSSLCLAKEMCWSVSSICMALRPMLLPAPDLSHCSQ